MPLAAGQAPCTSKTRDGDRCKNPPLPGQDVCRMHGGSSPQARAAAQRRLQTAAAQAAAHRLGVPIETSPQQALLDEVHRAAGMVAYYGQKVRELADDDAKKLVHGITKVETREGFQAGITKAAEPAVNVWLKLWNEERDRLTAVSVAAMRAGIEERRVLLAEQQGAMIAGAIRRILDRLNLTPDQRVLVGEIVPAELRALTTGGTPA